MRNSRARGIYILNIYRGRAGGSHTFYVQTSAIFVPAFQPHPVAQQRYELIEFFAAGFCKNKKKNILNHSHGDGNGFRRLSIFLSCDIGRNNARPHVLDFRFRATNRSLLDRFTFPVRPRKKNEKKKTFPPDVRLRNFKPGTRFGSARNAFGEVVFSIIVLVFHDNPTETRIFTAGVSTFSSC